METIIKQSADGIVLRGYNKLDTTQGKVFINNHEIIDIDTFFKVAEENTRLLEQVKKQKEVIDKAIEHLNKYESIKAYYEYIDEDGYDEYNYDEDFKKEILEILNEASE